MSTNTDNNTNNSQSWLSWAASGTYNVVSNITSGVVNRTSRISSSVIDNENYVVGIEEPLPSPQAPFEKKVTKIEQPLPEPTLSQSIPLLSNAENNTINNDSPGWLSWASKGTYNIASGVANRISNATSPAINFLADHVVEDGVRLATKHTVESVTGIVQGAINDPTTLAAAAAAGTATATGVYIAAKEYPIATTIGLSTAAVVGGATLAKYGGNEIIKGVETNYPNATYHTGTLKNRLYEGGYGIKKTATKQAVQDLNLPDVITQELLPSKEAEKERYGKYVTGYSTIDIEEPLSPSSGEKPCCKCCVIL